MQILILTHHYAPEVGAPQTRLGESASYLQRLGHHVEVLTALPSYPLGVIPPEYRGRRFVRETIQTVRTLRTWTFARPGGSARLRLANQLSFAGSALIAVPFLRRPDVILVESPPLFLGATGALLGAITGAAVVLHVSDLWPDVAMDLGALRAGPARGLARLFERTVYRLCDHVVVVTREWRDALTRRGVPPSKLSLVTNGVDVVRLDPHAAMAERRRLRAAMSLHGKTVVGCLGTIGNVYDYDLIVEAARRTRHRDDVAFLIVGGGSRSAWLRDEIDRDDLHNVILLPPQPRDQMPGLLGVVDVSMVALRALPVTRGILPVRVLEAMAMATPVVMVGEGEARRVVTEADAGIAVGAGNVEASIHALDALAADAGLRSRLGANGRRAVVARFSRDRVARSLERALLFAARRRRRRAV